MSDQLVSLSGHSTIFYNAFAAVPSLHVGFAFAISIALAIALPQRWAKALVLLWGPLVTLAVVATGNHFVFDAAAGLVVTSAGFAARHRCSRASPATGRARSGHVLVAT